MIIYPGNSIEAQIRSLGQDDPASADEAADMLARAGESAISPLINALRSGSPSERIGVAGVLGRIRDVRAIDPLTEAIHDEREEVRWAAALALGSFSDHSVIPPLRFALEDASSYVRHGAALSLITLGWTAHGDFEVALFWGAQQKWDALADLGAASLPALSLAVTDRDPSIRRKAAEVLGKVGDPGAVPLLLKCIADDRDEVRWQAVLVAPEAGVPLMSIPRALAMRPRAQKSPAVTALLNFLLPGMGYLYLGRWWGVLLFQMDVYLTLWTFSMMDENTSYALFLPIYLIFAVHGYYLAQKMPDPT
ncbi:MAG: HEAT repeat domain-containing protein [Methanomicrobiales archaeon]|nr:HEAT repeat domain-containing protein [Methanomicrobiales archaeon]